MTITSSFVERIKQRWMDHAPHLWWGDRIDARFLVAEALSSLSEARLLDVGCNAGVMLSEVPESNFRVGIDLSQEALWRARKLNPSVPLVVADMLVLPFKDSSFDVVLFCGMLEVLPREHKPNVLHEVVRVLCSGGQLHLTTLNRRYPRYRNSASLVTKEELHKLLFPLFHLDIKGFNPFPPFPYFLPNRLLAHVPGIWRILTLLMRWRVGIRYSCSFVVRATKRSVEQG